MSMRNLGLGTVIQREGDAESGVKSEAKRNRGAGLDTEASLTKYHKSGYQHNCHH